MLWDHLSAIERCPSMHALQSCVAKAADALGFEHFVLARRHDGPTAAQLHRLPQAWLSARYLSLRDGQVEQSDPLIRHVVAGGVPTPWNAEGKVLFTHPEIRRAAPRLLRVAGEFGLRTGMTIPLPREGANWSYMNFISGARLGLADMLHPLADAHLLAHFVDAAMRRIHGNGLQRQALSPREAQVLRWVALGKTSWDISRLLGVAERTINLHVANACCKLRVRGRSAACARALSEGRISL